MSDASRTYSTYLALDELLAAQHLNSDEHDELLFIVIHQVYELWFKQILHEGRQLQDRLTAGDTPQALHTLGRILTILKTLVAQIDVLETMTPLGFLSFRDRLDSASGFQSAQFRCVEALLGRRDLRMIEAYPEGSAERHAISAALATPSVFDSFLAYLDKLGFRVPAAATERDVRTPWVPSAAVQAAVLDAYRENREAAQVAERMVDLDEGVMEWRYRHVQMVRRTIGDRRGTGGSEGADYLARTLLTPSFPDLWAVRTQL